MQEPRNHLETSEVLAVRVSPETIELSTACKTIDLTCENDEKSFERILELIHISSVSAVAIVANRGLEQALAEWLRSNSIEVVVLHLPKPSIIDRIDIASETFSHVKLISCGFIAIFGGLFVICLGIQGNVGDGPLVPGGLWKGALIILAGIALIAVTKSSTHRSSRVS